MINPALAFIISSIDLLISLLLGISAVYFAIWLFDGITREVEEWKEIKKGNIAVAIYFGTVILGFAFIMEPQLVSISQDITSLSMNFGEAVLIYFLFDLVKLVVTIIIAAFVLYITLVMIDSLSHGMHKFEQLKKGNIAVAITMSVILIAVVIILQDGITTLANLIDPINLLVIFG